MSFINPVASEIIEAAKNLINGGLVAFPTETVYGLGADAENELAVKRIYQVKGRPENHPLIVHISNAPQMHYWAKEIPRYATLLAKRFWPGPLTLILKRKETAKDFLTGSQDTIGLRIPNHPIALALLEKFSDFGGNGLAAPSANRFGKLSPTSADAVREELSIFLNANRDIIIEGGECEVGIESTIVNCTSTNPQILRPGFITNQMIQECSGLKSSTPDFGQKFSGNLNSHYSPNATVVLNRIAQPGEGFIALANFPTPKGVIRLGSPENISRFMNSIYSDLRHGDRKGLKIVVVQLPTYTELTAALWDRLLKASYKETS